VVEVVPGIVTGPDGDVGVVSDEELTGERTAASGAIVVAGGVIPNALAPHAMTTRPVPPASSTRQRLRCWCRFATYLLVAWK
jgi:hypothetical protein